MADGSQSQPTEGSGKEYRAQLRFMRRRSLPMMLQTEGAECAVVCLTMIASYHGHDVDVAGLRARFPTLIDGTSLARVIAIARQLGFNCRALKLDINDLRHLKMPCLLHWDMNHFVVLQSIGRRRACIHDPAHGIRKISFKEVSEHFTGVALELTPSIDFTPVRERKSISIRALAGPVEGLFPAMTQILILAITLEIFALAGPFYIQWVLDQVIVSADYGLLSLLGTGFASITFFSAVIAAVRTLAVAWMGARLNVQWASNLFRHLMRLPLDWFERRHVGDVVSRFGSIETIQRTLTTQFIGSVLDGLMSLATLIVMGFYSVPLTLLVALMFVAYALIRRGFFNPLRRANEEQIVYAARQHSELLESVRGVMPIKLAGKQDERLGRYINAMVFATNRAISIQQLNVAFTFSSHVIVGFGRVALIWVAATLVLKDRMSVGMLIAFIAFADQFISRAISLIDKSVDFTMLKLHGERIADIALTEPEASADTMWLGSLTEARIELRNISFRYGEDGPWLIRSCSLCIEPGESVAITGPSGCGKSTLVKIILGLLDPMEGEVRFNGVDIRKIGLTRYRQWVGAVMQNDHLFAGSIAENISFFDPNASQERIEAAARLAAVHDEITKTGMGYFSPVGDMGSSLSGGQKQRIILARALYRQPALLVLDEATSHLDIAREARVNSAIEGLNVTRIIIAHRAETILRSGRVINLSDYCSDDS